MSATAPRVDARHHELGELLRLLRAVDRRPDRVVLVTGEAGIGKTYLARAAVARLGGEGFRVAWGRADPVERAVPYAAIGQVLASVSGPDVEGGQVVLVWEPDHVTGRDAVVREVYRPVGSLFERQCAERPLVVVVDDLHHADQDTLLLLGFLVRRLVHLPIAWLFTLRSRLAEPAAGLERLLHGLGEDGRLDEWRSRRCPMTTSPGSSRGRRSRPRCRRAAGDRRASVRQPLLRRPARAVGR